MTLEETGNLVRFVAAIDGRRVTRDTVQAWHQMLAGYTYLETKRAAESAVKNTSRDYITVAEIVAVIRGEYVRAGSTGKSHCDHGVPLGTPCHDCTHDPEWCQQCMPIAGVSDTRENMRATVPAFREVWGR